MTTRDFWRVVGLFKRGVANEHSIVLRQEHDITRCDSSPASTHNHRATLFTVMRCVELFVAYDTLLLRMYWGWCQGKKLAPRVVLLYVG